MLNVLKLGLLISFFSLSLKASAVCFATVEEYKKVQTEFPPEFQKYPVYIVTDGKLGTAAIQVRDAGSKFKIDAYFRKGYAIDRDDAYIDNLCYVDGKIIINYEKDKKGKKVKDIFNGTYDQDAKTLGTFFSTFMITDKAEYDRVAAKISTTEEERKNSKMQGGSGAQ